MGQSVYLEKQVTLKQEEFWNKSQVSIMQNLNLIDLEACF
jgi:hypothetical protein